MTSPIKAITWMAAVATLGMGINAAEARGFGGGGSVGRGSAGRGAYQPSLPSNYGSVRPATRPSGSYQTGTVNTPRGGQATVGTTPGGGVAVRGETAQGRDYAGIQSAGGNQLTARETPGGDVAVRYRGDGDDVIHDLPAGYAPITVAGNPYYYNGSRYYWPYYYGGEVYYEEVYAPAGAVVTNLPPAAAPVQVGGNQYYLYDDVYYVQQDGNYVVTAPPQDAPAVETPAAPTPDPREILRAMDTYLAACKSFQVETTESTATPQAGGGQQMSDVKRSVLVQQPDHLAATGQRGDAVNRFWYDGQTATLLQEARKAYARVEAPGGNAAMLNLLRNDYGVTIPLADLLIPGLLESVEPRIQTIRYAGVDSDGPVPCHMISFMTDDLQAQLWVENNEKTPRPRKVQVIYYTHPGQPRYQATIDSWNDAPDIQEGAFTFTPPAGTTQIEMVPVGAGS